MKSQLTENNRRDLIEAARLIQAVIDESDVVVDPVPSPLPPPPPLDPVPPAVGYSVVHKNMTDMGGGYWTSTDLHTNRVAYAQARLDTAAKPGQTVGFTYAQKTNVVYDGTKNLKDERDWPDSTTQYPNDYSGQTVGSKTHKFTVENGDGKVVYQKNSPLAWNVCYYNFPHLLDTEQTITKEIRYSSATGKPDGHIKITVDGVLVLDLGGLICNGPRRDFGAQMVYAPNTGDSGDLPANSYYACKILSLTVK